MKGLRTIAGEYRKEDIYNMYETALFWRKTISKVLATESIPGTKKDKTRVSLVCCVNCTGSDRVLLWFLGVSKNPRQLRGVNFNALSLGGTWRGNKKWWMTTELMKKWLASVYAHIGR